MGHSEGFQFDRDSERV